MLTRTISPLTRLLAIAALVFATATPLLLAPSQVQAQSRSSSSSDDDAEQPLAPPEPVRPSETPSPLSQYAMIALIVALGFGANMIPSKRTHQD